MYIVLYSTETVNVIDSSVKFEAVSVDSGIAKCILYCIVFYRDCERDRLGD